MARKSPKRTPKRKRAAVRREDDTPVDPTMHVMVAGKHMSLSDMHGDPTLDARASIAQPGITVTPMLGHALPGDPAAQDAAAHQGAPVILGFAARVRAAKRRTAEGKTGQNRQTDDQAADLRPVPVKPA